MPSFSTISTRITPKISPGNYPASDVSGNDGSTSFRKRNCFAYPSDRLAWLLGQQFFWYSFVSIFCSCAGKISDLSCRGSVILAPICFTGGKHLSGRITILCSAWSMGLLHSPTKGRMEGLSLGTTIVQDSVQTPCWGNLFSIGQYEFLAHQLYGFYRGLQRSVLLSHLSWLL